jgi:hypothetical protein
MPDHVDQDRPDAAWVRDMDFDEDQSQISGLVSALFDGRAAPGTGD